MEATREATRVRGRGRPGPGPRRASGAPAPVAAPAATAVATAPRPAVSPGRGTRTGADAFAGRHVLSMAQYSRDDLEQLFAAADETRASLAAGMPRRRPLAGRLLVSAFFERSTRTRLAHESAMLRLGGEIAGFAEPSITRAGGSTGESAEDIARMVSLYGDVAVVRHPETGWPQRAARTSQGALFINGGDGVGEHPTQTMVDLYTARQRFGTLDNLRFLIVNDLGMRCVRSLLLALREFDCEVYAVSADGSTPPSIPGAPPVTLCETVTDALSDVDVVYSSPTVTEPKTTTPGQLRQERPHAVTLHRELLETHANDWLTVLHPLPRKSEVSTDLDDTRFNGYWTQAANGIPVRMALLNLMFGA